MQMILEREPIIDHTLINISIIIMFALVLPLVIRISPKNIRILVYLSGVIVVS